jgi:rhodanese-related sulfurtransferase
MSKGVCASCVSFSVDSIVKSQANMKPTWLHERDYVEEFIEKIHDFSIRHNSNEITVDLEMKKMANRKILYWAAKPKSYRDVTVKDAKTAYGNFSNYGVAKCDANGRARVYLKFPQVYSTVQKGHKKPQSFHPHIHFVISDVNEKKWLKQIYTKILIKNIDFSELMKNNRTNNYVLLNTLPAQYYARDHIPNSYNLHNNEIKKMSVDDLHSWFREIIELHYPSLLKLVKEGKLEIYEIPIICYCAHKDCNASELAMRELVKKGFINVLLYEGGMAEYNAMK